MQPYPERWMVVGDSHVRGVPSEQLLLPVEIVPVGGATAIGLRNPNSTTDAIGTFRAALLPMRQGVVPVVHIGEVDCGFVIWWRAARFNEPVRQQLDQSVVAHLAFVDSLLAAGYPTVVLTSPTPPTILDGQDWGEVANLRREVQVLIKARTELTWQYAERLSTGARERGLPFVDLLAEVIDPISGVVAESFRSLDPTDHHLHRERMSQIWAAKLNAIGSALAGTCSPV